jgi:N utilization substance protein B
MARPGKSLARERALQCLYSIEIGGHSEETGATAFCEQFPEEKASPYFFRLVQGVMNHREELDAYISRFSEHWRLERMAAIDRVILRLAVFELLYSPEVPPKVAVNEAVEMGKRFGSENSGAFINGILDSFLKTVKPATAMPPADAEVGKGPGVKK